jgi:ParB/RepB/Spo0J family partition protein
MGATLTSKPLSFFKPDPGNPRTCPSIEELRELRDSLCVKQMVPLLARPDGQIIDGFRRYSAASLDGKPERLDVIITDEPLTLAQIKEIQLVTALHRAGLKPWEEYVACRDWMALNKGATAKDLAARIQRDQSMLVRILSLGRCMPAVQKAAAEGKLGPSAWYEISKVPEAEQEALLAAKLAGATRDQIGRQGRRLRNDRKPVVRVSRLTIPLGQGNSVTIAGSKLALDDAIELLQETLKLARKAQADNLDGKTFMQVMKQKSKAASE